MMSLLAQLFAKNQCQQISTLFTNGIIKVALLNVSILCLQLLIVFTNGITNPALLNVSQLHHVQENKLLTKVFVAANVRIHELKLILNLSIGMIWNVTPFAIGTHIRVLMKVKHGIQELAIAPALQKLSTN
jgi:hypothetical protein